MAKRIKAIENNRGMRNLFFDPPVIGKMGRSNNPNYLARNNYPSRVRRGRKSFKQTQAMFHRPARTSSRLVKTTFLR